MTYAEFQERWELEAGKEFDHFMTLEPGDLCQRVQAGQFGEYYTIWRAVTDKCRLADVRDSMMRILRSDADYLIRYHCAEALISLAGAWGDGFRAVELSGRNKHNVDRRLDEFEEFLQTKGQGARAEPGGNR